MEVAEKFRIWHISDTHTFHETLKVPDNIDLVIFSGDCSNPREPVPNAIEVINFLNWFCALPIKHKIFVAGNHDTSIEKNLVSQVEFTERGITYLENSWTNVEGLLIYGSPYTPSFGHGWAYNKERAKMFKIWDAIPESINIIITHGPPQGILDIVTHYSQDRTYTNVLEYCGCFSLRKWCEKNQPDLVCFGHIHNNQKNINAGIRTIANSNTIFSNGSCVTDAKFDYGCTSHGNVFEVDENKKITICQ